MADSLRLRHNVVEFTTEAHKVISLIESFCPDVVVLSVEFIRAGILLDIYTDLVIKFQERFPGVPYVLSTKEIKEIKK